MFLLLFIKYLTFFSIIGKFLPAVSQSIFISHKDRWFGVHLVIKLRPKTTIDLHCRKHEPPALYIIANLQNKYIIHVVYNLFLATINIVLYLLNRTPGYLTWHFNDKDTRYGWQDNDWRFMFPDVHDHNFNSPTRPS